MTADEWLAAVLADRPPLTQAQISTLRPIFAPVLPHMKTAPAANGGRSPQARTTRTPERSRSEQA